MKKITIKKYTNRRLYNTATSSYVNLAQIADLIRDMNTINVIDAKTEEDVTAYILTQVILEDAKNKNALLPVPLIHTFIRYGDNILKDFFDKHLNSTIQSYIQHKSEFDDHFRKFLEIGSEFNNITQKTMNEIFPMKSFMDIFNKNKESDPESDSDADEPVNS